MIKEKSRNIPKNINKMGKECVRKCHKMHGKMSKSKGNQKYVSGMSKRVRSGMSKNCELCTRQNDELTSKIIS